MDAKPVEAVIPLKIPLNIVPPVPEVVEPEVYQGNLDEYQVSKILTENKNSIILVFGQKVYTANRSDIRKNIKNPENIFVDSAGKKYFQIFGRHLVDEDEIKAITNRNLSIFNISTLKDVVRVNTKASPINVSRSVYKVDPYTVDEYNEILNEK